MVTPNKRILTSSTPTLLVAWISATKVLTLAYIHKMLIYQMDVKIAFLNDDLEEEIYMSQPEGFITK